MDWRAVALGLFFVAAWSSAFTSARIVVADAPAFLALCVRFLFSGGIALAIGWAMGQRISLTRMHLLGMLGQLRNGSKHQVVDAATAYTSSVSATIAGGTSEINRNIIATRGLGLPRG